MSRGGCGAENSVEDTEELAAKAAALKAKQDKAEVAKAAKAAKQKRRKLLGLRWHWLLPQFMGWLTCTTTSGQSNARLYYITHLRMLSMTCCLSTECMYYVCSSSLGVSVLCI
jgi:hypothetical protein